MRRKLGFLTAPQANSQAKDLQTFTPTGDGNIPIRDKFITTLASGFTNLYPDRGRKQDPYVSYFLIFPAIYKPLPRQGTETFWKNPLLSNFNSRIYKPLPRQGTET